MKKTAAVLRSGVEHLLDGATRSSRQDLAASWPGAARSEGNEDGDGSQKDTLSHREEHLGERMMLLGQGEQ